MPALEFLRMAKSVRIGPMLRLGPVKARLQEDCGGISYTEFSYQLLQAYDWNHLAREYDCFFQVRLD